MLQLWKAADTNLLYLFNAVDNVSLSKAKTFLKYQPEFNNISEPKPQNNGFLKCSAITSFGKILT